MHPHQTLVEYFGDGLDIKCIHSQNAIAPVLMMYFASADGFAINWLDYIPKYGFHDCLLICLTPYLLTQILGEINSNYYTEFTYRIKITNPSILHLFHLLETEIQAPQAFNQEFVLTIVTVMIRYCENQKLPGMDIISKNEDM